MKRWWLTFLLLLLAATFYWVYRSAPKSAAPPANAEVAAAPNPPKTTVPASRAAPEPHAVASLESASAPSSGSTPTSNATVAAPAQVEPLPTELANIAPETALENMRTVIRQYGSMFAGNPVGTNPEITEALQGQNPKHINFLKSDGNRVNSRGELVDVWGTPYFFHQISGSEMEIRSAGPDRIMYTADDLVTK